MVTINSILNEFKNLHERIAADGVITKDEADEIMDFIAPYARSGNKDFMRLYAILANRLDDGSVSEYESAELLSEMDAVAEFLRREAKIEKFLAVFFGFGLLLMILKMIF